MRKYIVPVKDKIQNWKSFFAEVFRDEEHQTPLMLELVNMAMWLSLADKQNEEDARFSLMVSSMGFVGELASTGMLHEDDIDNACAAASEFAMSLVGYLKEVSVLRKNNVMKFECFTGMDMVIKILDDGEIEEVDERACLSG